MPPHINLLTSHIFRLYSIVYRIYRFFFSLLRIPSIFSLLPSFKESNFFKAFSCIIFLLKAAVVGRSSRDGSQGSSVRAIEEEEMTLCAESKESLSIAHSSPTALTEPSGIPEEDHLPGC